MSQNHEYISIGRDTEFIGSPPVICKQCLNVFGTKVHSLTDIYEDDGSRHVYLKIDKADLFVIDYFDPRYLGTNKI